MRPQRRRRVVAGSVTGAVVVAGALVTGYALVAEPRASEAAPAVPTQTAPVTRGTVSQRLRLSGTYGFDGAWSVSHQGGAGILTGVAAAGARTGRGGVLYRVDDRPVRLLFGAMPAHRDLRLGMSDGADVRELERNLKSLGADPDGAMTVDHHFTAATAAAVRRLQKSWGLSWSQRTGELPLGSVVFLPGTIRISKAEAKPGTSVRPDQPVLSATGTERVVTASVTADRQGQVTAGDDVTVTLPGATEVKGKVLRIGRVATAAKEAAPATVDVVIRVTVPRGAPDLDQAPVQVTLATAERKDVLTVPVAALLARPGSGYRLRAADGTYVDVEPGLFDDATGAVEVTGDVHEGDRVEVPAS